MVPGTCSFTLPATVVVDEVSTEPSAGARMPSCGGVVFNVTVSEAVPTLPAASVAVTVSMFCPSRNVTVALNEPPEFAVATPFTDTVSFGLSTVPFTVTGLPEALNTLSGVGLMIVICGGGAGAGTNPTQAAGLV